VPMSRVKHVRCPRNPSVGRRLSIQRGTGTWAGCRGRPGEGLGRQDVSLRSTPGACGGARSVLVLAPHDGSGSLAMKTLVVLSPLLEWGAAAGGASGWGAGATKEGPPGEERAQGMPPRDEASLMGGVPGRAPARGGRPKGQEELGAWLRPKAGHGSSVLSLGPRLGESFPGEATAVAWGIQPGWPEARGVGPAENGRDPRPSPGASRCWPSVRRSVPPSAR